MSEKEIQWVRTPLGWVKRIIYRYRRQMCVVEFAAVDNQGDFSPCIISKVWGPL